MPREIVHCDGPYHVKVGWSPDRDVQVGVEGDEGRSLLWLLYGDEEKRAAIGRMVAGRLAEQGVIPTFDGTEDIPVPDDQAIWLGTMILNSLDVVSDQGERGYAGVWADLDRHGANRLIRLVRKARDSAFGADA